MSQSGAGDEPTLSLEALRRIDQVCARFESAWQAKTEPLIEEYLGPAAEPERSQLFLELLQLDLELRGQRGEVPDREGLCARFPDYTETVDSVLRALVSRATEAHQDPAGAMPSRPVPGSFTELM